jgi:hypothetical protein
MIRRFRILLALVAAVMLLFAQLAVHAHVCAGNGDMAAASMQVGASQDGSDCDQTIIDAPALCQFHCDQGKQSLDKPDLPALPDVRATGFTLVPVVRIDGGQRELRSNSDRSLTRATDPPLSIRNCCFRI